MANLMPKKAPEYSFAASLDFRTADQTPSEPTIIDAEPYGFPKGYNIEVHKGVNFDRNGHEVLYNYVLTNRAGEEVAQFSYELGKTADGKPYINTGVASTVEELQGTGVGGKLKEIALSPNGRARVEGATVSTSYASVNKDEIKLADRRLGLLQQNTQDIEDNIETIAQEIGYPVEQVEAVLSMLNDQYRKQFAIWFTPGDKTYFRAGWAPQQHDYIFDAVNAMNALKMVNIAERLMIQLGISGRR